MGVIYIGDRATGKTHLLVELANPNSDYVTVTEPKYQELKADFCDQTGTPIGTGSFAKAVLDHYIEVSVTLPTGEQMIKLDWLDTPGEIWTPIWRNNKPDEWNRFLEFIREAEGILLILEPYRERIKAANSNPDDFITQQQWCNRFSKWVDFFRQDCPKIRHLILCLNKADLLFSEARELKEEGNKLGFNPNIQRMTWQDRDNYIFQRYFRPIHPQINQLNRNIKGLSVRCFITSIYNRKLLELPWIYLGSHLAK